MEGGEGFKGKEIEIKIPDGFHNEGRYQVITPGRGVDSGTYYVDTRPADYGKAVSRRPEPRDYEWETLYKRKPDNAVLVRDSDHELSMDLLPQGMVWRLKELLVDRNGTHAKTVHNTIVALVKRGASLAQIEEAVERLL